MNKQSIGEMLRKIERVDSALEEYSGVWKNMYLFEGGSRLGDTEFPTAQLASEYVERMRIDKASRGLEANWTWNDHFQIRDGKVTCIFPIPVKS